MKTMRILFIMMGLLFIAGKAGAQLSLIVFSENGEKFTAYVNNDPRNDKPASRVETTRPGGPSFKLRILFESSAIPEISKTIFNSPGPDLIYVVRKNDKGKFVLEKTSTEYAHHDDATVASEEKSTKKEEKPASEPAKSETKQSNGNGGKGCTNPMNDPDFYASREMISNAPFDGPKLTQAKSLADKHCLATSQIVDVIYIFSGESARLNFAKYAYKHCWDPTNYDKVKDALRSSSQSELQNYIDTQK